MSETSGAGEILKPQNAKIEDIEGNRMLLRGEESFYLSHRRFDEIDTYFSGMVSQHIEELLGKIHDRPVRILDLGGGVGSEAVRDVQQKYGDRVTVINVDIAHEKQEENNVQRVQAEVEHLPFATGSIDMAYSYQLFPFLKRLQKEHDQHVRQGVAEIARVLSPGGVAFINDEEELSGIQHKSVRDQLERELGVDLETKDSKRIEQVRQFPRVWKKHLRPEKFLYMEKKNEPTRTE